MRVVEAFDKNRDWAVVMGRVVADGVRGPGFDWETGLTMLRSATINAGVLEIVDHVGAYGCNMSIRTSFVGELRFNKGCRSIDSRNIDFTSQLRRCGRVVALRSLLGVHLGLKSGRVSGVRFGYSQVANPVYLIKKDIPPSLPSS